MKHSLPVIVLLIVCGYSSYAQPLMQTLQDVQKLQDSAHLFVDKPLKTLLKEIGPTIKTVFTDSHRPHHALSVIIFKFIDKEEQGKYNLAGKRSLSLLVYIKENFDWNKSKEARLQWTVEDAERLGNLTIYRIDIVGETL
jgi:hypothetical protein